MKTDYNVRIVVIDVIVAIRDEMTRIIKERSKKFGS